MYLNNNVRKYKTKNWQKAIILFLMLFFTDFMSFRSFDGIQRTFIFPLVCFLFYLLFKDQKYLKDKYMATPMKFTMISFFLSCLPSIFIFGQNLYQALAGLLLVLFPSLLYFLLHKWNISENTIFKYLLGFTIVYAFFEVFQQFSYPNYWFGARGVNEITGLLENRMGFWRFYFFGVDYCILCIMLVLGRILSRKGTSIINFLYFAISAVAIYMFLSRKDIYATVSCIAIAIIFARGKTKLWQKIVLASALLMVYLFLSNSMLDLNIQTTEEMGEGNEDFIRMVAANHFIYSFSDSPLYYILGSGIPGGDNDLQMNLNSLAQDMHIYQDDCGFVGYFSRFGIIGLAFQIYVIWRILRNHKYVDLSLLIFLLLNIEISFFDFWGNNTRHMAAWAIFLFLVDKSIERNKVGQ
jgi:hypothetical protein